MEIAALVSGGVDSSVIVPLLKEQGIDPHIFYIKIGLEGKEDLMDCPSEEDIEITTFIAKKYGCKFDIVDLQKEYYDRVAAYTMAPNSIRMITEVLLTVEAPGHHVIRMRKSTPSTRIVNPFSTASSLMTAPLTRS